MIKWFIWLIGIVFTALTLWIVGITLLYNYEIKNDCEFHITDSVPFFKCQVRRTGPFVFKPLILLYPKKDTNVNINLEYSPGFSATYPEYNTSKKGWSVLAHSDGTLKDFGTNQDTYGLFWEGNRIDSSLFDVSKGFVVKGSDIRDFLYNKLTEIGLNTKEKSDFITFWYPKLQEYPYIQITFAGKDYTDIAKLDINPKPDSLLRVFMVAKPLTEYREIPEQKLEKFERKGFSVVEWGGTIVQ